MDCPRAHALIVALLTAAAPRTASANGRFPSAQHVLIGPGAGSRTIALRTTFGFVISDDGGASFHYVCEEALDYGTRNYDPPFAMDRDGRLHVGLFDGLVRASADRCVYQRSSAFADLLVTDLDNDPTGSVVAAVAAPAFPGARNHVYRSDDGGETFVALGEGLSGLTFDTLEMAPTDTRRVYLSGLTFTPRRVVIYRSDDGGATLREMPFTPPAMLDGAYIAAVDPRDADIVYVRGTLAPTDASATRGTVLLRSRDGGNTWEELARTRGAMLGFAISDDGRTLWMGGPDAADRLQRSDDGGTTWKRISDVEVLCLRQHAGVLYVCANYLSAGYALGRSHDGGSTIEPLVRFEDVDGVFACPRGSPETDLCAPRWATLRAQYFSDAGAPGSDASTLDAHLGDARDDIGSIDGGSDDAPSAPRACGCAAPGTATAAPSHWSILAALLVAYSKRRRHS